MQQRPVLYVSSTETQTWSRRQRERSGFVTELVAHIEALKCSESHYFGYRGSSRAIEFDVTFCYCAIHEHHQSIHCSPHCCVCVCQPMHQSNSCIYTTAAISRASEARITSMSAIRCHNLPNQWSRNEFESWAGTFFGRGPPLFWIYEYN